MPDSNRTSTEELAEKSVDELIRIIDKSPDGSYAFLVGAGVSNPPPANIPLSSEMIAEFQRSIYTEKGRDLELNEWTKEYEKNHKGDDESQYGFWFSNAYPNLTSRREKISQIVQGAEPPLGQMILASMLQKGVISHVFTPNFDDLLVNASIDLPGRRPLFVDHDARASRIQFPSDRPAIIKVHGDFLHYTKNTDEETSKLSGRVETAFRRSLQSYGLVVLGYGGSDDSIMNVLEDEKTSEKGVYWCKLTNSEISERVYDFIDQEDNAYIVEIEGSERFFEKILRRSEDVDLPDPQEFEEKAKNTANRIRSLLEDRDSIPINYGEGDFSSHSTELEGSHDFVELADDEDYKEALERINDLLSEDPDNESAYFYRGYINSQLGNLESAIEDVYRTIDIDPSHKEAYAFRGVLNGKLGNHREALDDLDKSIDLDPEFGAAYQNRGLANLHSGDYTESINDYDTAIDLGLDHYSNYFNRGYAKSRLGNLQEAISDFTRAIETGPEDAETYFNRGNIKLELDELDSAISDYDAAIEQDSNYQNAYVNRGFAKMDQGRYESAIEDFNKAIELDPEDEEVYFNRANAKCEIGNFASAVDDYNKAIELDHEYVSAYVNRGNAKHELGDNKEAIEDCTKAINIDPDEEIYLNRGSFKLDESDYEGAIEDFTKALDHKSDYLDAYISRARAKYYVGDIEGALGDYSEAIDIDEEALVSRIEKAELLLHDQEYQEAKVEAKRVRGTTDSSSLTAISLLLICIVDIVLENEDSPVNEYQSLCQDNGDLTWNFEHIESWLDEAEISDSKEIEIRDLIGLFLD